jgi:hypothetical protein
VSGLEDLIDAYVAQKATCKSKAIAEEVATRESVAARDKLTNLEEAIKKELRRRMGGSP